MLLVLVFIVFHFLLNLLLSREIFYWVPGWRIQAGYYTVLWLLPVVGPIVVWWRVQPGWFTRETGNADRMSMSSGLLALDAIFNPGAVHVLAAQKSSEITIRMEGEMYDRDLPEYIKIDHNEQATREPGTDPKD